MVVIGVKASIAASVVARCLATAPSPAHRRYHLLPCEATGRRQGAPDSNTGDLRPRKYTMDQNSFTWTMLPPHRSLLL
ncbi:unnamed protein product [Lactuca virosa]|uniref:Secreted protein n=1 Tax=Lactuca virosa TaxID=75947 RepID=A0AAU9LAP5_9ASTR|nr:unnamed protein product [Lactuca virosa]